MSQKMTSLRYVRNDEKIWILASDFWLLYSKNHYFCKNNSLIR